jgi:putative membrane protein
MLPLG